MKTNQLTTDHAASEAKTSAQYACAKGLIDLLIEHSPEAVHRKDEIVFVSPNRQPYAALSRSGLILSASKRDTDGKFWFSHLSGGARSYLGMVGLTHAEEISLGEELAAKYFATPGRGNAR